MEGFKTVAEVRNITDRLSLSLFGQDFNVIVSQDLKGGSRIFIQVQYNAPCTHSGGLELWKGRKWYLSEHMTADEIVKTVYTAFKAAVEHEVMEGFKVDGKVLFNPHVNFEELLNVSHKEIKRDARID